MVELNLTQNILFDSSVLTPNTCLPTAPLWPCQAGPLKMGLADKKNILLA